MAAGVFLIPLIIFIAQNLNDAPIYFLGLNGQVSSGSPCYWPASAG